jgi:hypothetical protein
MTILQNFCEGEINIHNKTKVLLLTMPQKALVLYTFS